MDQTSFLLLWGLAGIVSFGFILYSNFIYCENKTFGNIDWLDYVFLFLCVAYGPFMLSFVMVAIIHTLLERLYK